MKILESDVSTVSPSSYRGTWISLLGIEPKSVKTESQDWKWTGSTGPLYRCINCIRNILLKILSLVLVRFRAVCFPRPRSAFSRSAVFGVYFRDTQVYRPVVNRCFVVTPLTYHRRSTDTPLTYHRLLSYTLSTVLNVQRLFTVQVSSSSEVLTWG